jgi:hypothetical protein
MCYNINMSDQYPLPEISESVASELDEAIEAVTAYAVLSPAKRFGKFIIGCFVEHNFTRNGFVLSDGTFVQPYPAEYFPELDDPDLSTH